MMQSQIIGKMHHHKGNIKNNDGHVGAAYHAAQERGGKNMLKTKEPKGITLISLVITIIILLILATVAISLAVDSNGLFGKAGDAANSWNTSVAEEEGSIQDMLDIAEEMYPTLKPMVTKWNIAAGDTVEIMLYSPEDMMGNALVDNTDVTINWGDGTEEHYTSSNLTNGKAGHTYTDANSSTTVTITGKCNVIGVMENTKLISIEEWGYTETTVYYFPACTGLARIEAPEKYTFKNVTSFIATFTGCSSLTSIPDNMFANCTNAILFYVTFVGCSSLTSIPDNMFANCTNATSFIATFAGCSSLTSIPDNMFANCTSATLFKETFYGCSSLASIGDYAFANCAALEDVTYMFAECPNLASIGAHAFDGCSSIEDFTALFGEPSSSIAKLRNEYATLKCIDIPVQDTYSIIPIGIVRFERKMENLRTIGDYAFANCTSAKNFDGLFADCVNLESIPEHLFENTPNVASFKGTFTGCTSLTGNALPLWTRVTTDTTTYKGVPDGYNCYKGCTRLTNYEAIPDYWKNAPSQG